MKEYTALEKISRELSDLQDRREELRRLVEKVKRIEEETGKPLYCNKNMHVGGYGSFRMEGVNEIAKEVEFNSYEDFGMYSHTALPYIVVDGLRIYDVKGGFSVGRGDVRGPSHFLWDYTEWKPNVTPEVMSAIKKFYKSEDF